jgi:hypothetical protein
VIRHFEIQLISLVSIVVVPYANIVDDAIRTCESNGSSATPPEQWPSHARKVKTMTTGFTMINHLIITLIVLLKAQINGFIF